jgi:protein-disulfide isomerase
MRNRIVHGLGVTALGVLVACGPSPEEMSELKSQQEAILGKIADLDKKLDQVAEAPPARPSRPQVDPNKVYNLPVGNSPFKGPENAKVAIVEFADFQ